MIRVVKRGKLSHRYVDLFEIIQNVSDMAYEIPLYLD